MRNCIDEGTLQTWFDGELDANAAATVTTHLNACVRCAESARTLEAENLILSEGLSAEFSEAIPTDRLRQRVNAAVAELQVAGAPSVNRSWMSALRDFLPSFRVLAYATATAAILLVGSLAFLYQKRDEPKGLAARDRLPDIALVTPKADQAVNTSGPKLSNSVPPRQVKSVRRNQPAEEQATSLAWQERQYNMPSQS